MYTTGFLIVLVEPEFPRNRLGTACRGVGRVPGYPSTVPEEAQAMDDYVFGDFKDEDDGLIHALEKARELLALFGDSPRRFELLYCETSPGAQAEPNPAYELLGYDVAVIPGDFWSIVSDFPDDPRMEKFTESLNTHGLFGNSTVAECFLREYQALSLPDYDMPFEVVRFSLVER